MGQRSQDCFPELADALDSIYQRVADGNGVALNDVLLPVSRDGQRADAWFDVVCTPVRGEMGSVDGIFCTFADTSATVLAKKMAWEAGSVAGGKREHQAFLLRLSDALRMATDTETIQIDAMQMLGDQLGVDRAFLFLVEREDGDWVQVIEHEFRRSPAQVSMIGKHSDKNYGSWMLE